MRDAIRSAVWGKLPRGGDPGLPHPLICHLLDTGFVAQAMWNHCLQPGPRAWLAGAFGLAEEDTGRWVAFLASLHDLGKATPQFQSAARMGHPEVSERLERAGLHVPGTMVRFLPHGLLTAAIAHKALACRPARLSDDLAFDLAVVLGGHHGAFPLAINIVSLSRQLGREPWQKMRCGIIQYLADVWLESSSPRPSGVVRTHQAAFRILAGLICTADWIASCETFFPYAGMNVDLDQYTAQLPGHAEDTLRRAGWLSLPGTPDDLDFPGLFGFSPREMQSVAIAVGRAMESPGLVLIEGPTGTGKTEAALAVAHDQIRRFGLQGMYFALPTQATSNQAFTRVVSFIEKAVPPGRVNIQLLHGQAMLNPDLQALRPGNVDTDHQAQNPGLPVEVVAEEWFLSSKRGLLSPFGVGTIDQALLAVLQTKHSFLRLFGLAGKVVILDEVHAYDMYTSTLLQALVRWLGRMGGSVVLLSATLPCGKRRELLEAFSGGAVDLPHVPYPRITSVSGGTASAVSFTSPTRPSIAVSHVPRDPRVLAQRLADALANGGCAACICNTVARSQDVYQAVGKAFADQNVWTALAHSRFPFSRRREIEREIVWRFGKDGWEKGVRPHRAVVVATQVIEQSLDLDFDLMVSDLAPADLLLQRAGRLHRHQSPPGGRPTTLDAPQLWLAMPQTDANGIPTFGTDAFVYEPYLLLRTWLAVAEPKRCRLNVPTDIEDLIKNVYGSDAPCHVGPEWQAALADAKAEMKTQEHGDGWLAQARMIPAPDDPDGVLGQSDRQLEAPSDESLLSAGAACGLTRKGRPSVRLVCLHELDGTICLDSAGTKPVDLDRIPTREELVALVEQSVTLTHGAVVRHFRDQRPPPGWTRAPILRQCRGAVFRNRYLPVGRGWTLCLDQDLGIVIDRPEKHEGED